MEGPTTSSCGSRDGSEEKSCATGPEFGATPLFPLESFVLSVWQINKWLSLILRLKKLLSFSESLFAFFSAYIYVHISLFMFSSWKGSFLLPTFWLHRQ